MYNLSEDRLEERLQDTIEEDWIRPARQKMIFPREAFQEAHEIVLPMMLQDSYSREDFERYFAEP